MTTPVQTPTRHEVSQSQEDSRLDDHSEDDSDVNRNGDVDRDKQEKLEDHDDHYKEEADTSYSLFSNPPNLVAMRRQLFEVKDEFEMSAQEFEEYFPFVDNVWRKYRIDQKDNDPNCETFCCRLRPSNQHKSSTPKAPAEGKQTRTKRKREEKTCPMLMKVTYIASPIKKVKVTRVTAPDLEHSHDLEYMDHNKRNTAIMDVARREAVRGFLPGSIFWKMQQEPDKMDEAGGKHMKISDVRNVQYPWRQQNPTAILKAHVGYTQQRTGPRQPKLASTMAAASAPPTPNNGAIQRQIQSYVPFPLQPPPVAQLAPTPLPQGTLNYPEHAKEFLYPYLPHVPRIASQSRPHITLTWATSLDSRVALLPGVQTAISGPETKAMTHFLRSQHDAILIGVKTAMSDDPGLNCRLAGAGGFGGPDRAMQPRPIVIDPRARLHIHSEMRLLRAVREGKAQGPWVVVGPHIKLQPQAVTTLKAHGGEFLQINEIDPYYGLDWEALFSIFHREGIKSIMVEGGGKVLSDLLKPRYAHCVDSIIMTIAPTFFGKGGVEVAPDTAFDGQQPIQTRLANVKWQPMGQSDMVLCGQLDKARTQPRLPGIQEFSRQPASTPVAPQHAAPPSVLPPPQQHAPPPPSQGPPAAQHNANPLAPQTQGPPPLQNNASPLPASNAHILPAPQPVQPPRPLAQINGASTSAPPGKSPKFRHYGMPRAP